MSALPDTEYKSISPVMMARRERARVVPARPVVADERAGDALSPTVPIQKVLLTIGIALIVGLILNARSIVHDAEAMQDGPVRDATVFIGNAALSVAEATDLTWPRDQLDAALGNAPQPAISLLLASAGNGSQVSVNIPAGDQPMLQIGSLDTGAPLYKTPLASPSRVPAHVAVPIVPTATATPTTTPKPTSTRMPSSTKTPCAGAVAGDSCRGLVARNAGSGAAMGSHPQTSRCSTWHDESCKPKPSRTPQQIRVPKATATSKPTATPTAGPPPRIVTAGQPLRLLVTGDSLSGYLGPQLVDKASKAGQVTGFVDTHNGTGLTRPDFVDWGLVAQQQVASDQPDAVVVIIGGNDFQNMTLPNGQVFIAGTPAWTKEYQRRAEICMRIWAQGGSKRVYWLSMPPARNTSWAFDDHQINRALKAAAANVPGARYVDVLGQVTDHGKYVDYIHWHGQWVLIREPDGVHLNEAGSDIVAGEVLSKIQREWHLQ